jgi:hypothetical protein
MPITRHHSGRWLYQFNRVVPGAGRQRANRLLPQGWSKKQADEYDRIESARLYALATGVTKSQPLIKRTVRTLREACFPSVRDSLGMLESAVFACLVYKNRQPTHQ